MTDCKQYIIAHFGRRFYKNYFKACHGRALALFLHGVMFRSSHQRCSMKKDVLRNFSEFTGKHLCHSLCLGLQLYLKKRLWHRCFPVNLEKFLRTPFLQNTSGRLLLYVHFFMVNVLHLSIFHRNSIFTEKRKKTMGTIHYKNLEKWNLGCFWLLFIQPINIL